MKLVHPQLRRAGEAPHTTLSWLAFSTCTKCAKHAWSPTHAPGSNSVPVVIEDEPQGKLVLSLPLRGSNNRGITALPHAHYTQESPRGPLKVDKMPQNAMADMMQC